MNAEQKDEFLKDEYLLLQGFYEDYDRRTLLIKGWSVTVAIAGLASGFEKELPAIWTLSGIAAALFWPYRWEMANVSICKPQTHQRNRGLFS